MSTATQPSFERPPPTPPPTRPSTPDSMISCADSPRRVSSLLTEQQQPDPASPPAVHSITDTSTAAPTTTTLSPIPPRTPTPPLPPAHPSPSTRQSSPTPLRPLDHYFGPHLNHDHKQRRAVHEYMLCRATQELTALYLHRALHALLFLGPSLDAAIEDRLVWELASLLRHGAALHAAAARTVRTMWSLGLPVSNVARADAFVRGTAASSRWRQQGQGQRHSLADRFQLVFGASYAVYRQRRYHPNRFDSRDHAYWRAHFGLDEFRIEHREEGRPRQPRRERRRRGVYG